MKAFEKSEVTKDSLIASLEAHRDADRIISGTYWDRGVGGCSIGCAIHDYRPGQESEHELFPELFGIPVELAYLNDRIFEGLTGDKQKEWPIRFISAIRVGADLSDVINHFFYWMFTAENSPIHKWQKEDHVTGVATLYERRSAGDEPTTETWAAASDAASAAAWAAAWAAASDAAQAAASDAAWAAASDAAQAAASAAAWAAASAAAWAAASDAASAAAWEVMADNLVKLLEAA